MSAPSLHENSFTGEGFARRTVQGDPMSQLMPLRHLGILNAFFKKRISPTLWRLVLQIDPCSFVCPEVFSETDRRRFLKFLASSQSKIKHLAQIFPNLRFQAISSAKFDPKFFINTRFFMIKLGFHLFRGGATKSLSERDFYVHFCEKVRVGADFAWSYFSIFHISDNLPKIGPQWGKIDLFRNSLLNNFCRIEHFLIIFLASVMFGKPLGRTFPNY